MNIRVDFDVLNEQINRLKDLVEIYQAETTAAVDVSAYSGIPQIEKFNEPLNKSVSLLVADYKEVVEAIVELSEKLRVALAEFEAVDAEEAEKYEQLTEDLSSIEKTVAVPVVMVPAKVTKVTGGGRDRYSIM